MKRKIRCCTTSWQEWLRRTIQAAVCPVPALFLCSHAHFLTGHDEGWRKSQKLCIVFFSSRHRGYHSSLENQACKQGKGSPFLTYSGGNDYLKYIIFVLLASSLPPSQLVKLPLSPFLFRQTLGLLLPALHSRHPVPAATNPPPKA